MKGEQDRPAPSEGRDRLAAFAGAGWHVVRVMAGVTAHGYTPARAAVVVSRLPGERRFPASGGREHRHLPGLGRPVSGRTRNQLAVADWPCSGTALARPAARPPRVRASPAVCREDASSGGGLCSCARSGIVSRQVSRSFTALLLRNAWALTMPAAAREDAPRRDMAPTLAAEHAAEHRELTNCPQPVPAASGSGRRASVKLGNHGERPATMRAVHQPGHRCTGSGVPVGGLAWSGERAAGSLGRAGCSARGVARTAFLAGCLL